MKLGIVGKGGTGKTTISALMAQTYAARGRRVLAVDTDSNPNLAFSLGFELGPTDQIPIIPRSLAIGTGNGQTLPADLVREYGLATPAEVTVLHAMAVTQAGAGCTCGSHASVRSLLGSAIDEEAEVTIVDMEAGLEHLSRAGGTLAYADVLLVVMEPSRKSVLTAGRTLALAEELGIARVYGVGNKARLPDDADFYREAATAEGITLIGVIPHDDDVVAAERAGMMVGPGQAAGARRAVEDIMSRLESPEEERQALLRARERLERQLAHLEKGLPYLPS
jgi:CO dehydrogenase maturation factor